MISNNYLNKNDYDFYTIDLGKIKPFTASSVIEKKIFVELEKLHPCFSDYCTFDYVLKSSGMNTIAKVVVIDSMFLIEYKNSHNTYFIRIEEFKKRKCFLSHKQKKIKNILGLSFILLLFILFTFFIVKNTLTKKQVLENIPHIIEHSEEKNTFDVKDFIDLCLPFFANSDIKVSYFEYDSTNIPQIILHTNGIQREEIENQILGVNKDLEINFSATTYSNKIPNLSFTVHCDKQSIKTASFCDIQTGLTAIRNAIFSVNGLPISEEIETRQYQCIIPYNSLSAFFNNLIRIQEEQQIKFEKLIFDYDQEIGNLNCIFVLDKLKSEEQIDFSNFLSIFKKPIEKLKAVPVQQKTETIKTDNRVLVGKMPAADGSIILYYRTPEGKIVYEKE